MRNKQKKWSQLRPHDKEVEKMPTWKYSLKFQDAEPNAEEEVLTTTAVPLSVACVSFKGTLYRRGARSKY